MNEKQKQASIVSLGTLATGIDLAAAIIDDLVGNGITGVARAGNVEANLGGSETISLVATRMNTQLNAAHNLTPPSE